MDKFFLNESFVIDEKVQVLTMKNSYKVYDAQGQDIGMIKENLPASRMLLSLFVSKSNLPFELDFFNAEGRQIAAIKRGFTFFTSKCSVHDESGQIVGYIKQKFSLKPKFTILNASEQEVAVIQGDWIAWDFKISDKGGTQIGQVSKKWNGAMKELFTDADKYNVTLSPSVADENVRIAIVATAAAVDMILKEDK